MTYRQAQLSDIRKMQIVRHSVIENMLSDPSLVPDKDVADYITNRGKGWVCEEDRLVVGFAIADLVDHNIWALFVLPEYEGKGIGKKLHDLMIAWYFQQTDQPVWLGTAPGTRAEKFYRSCGWTETGVHSKGEIKFEMRYDQWKLLLSVK